MPLGGRANADTKEEVLVEETTSGWTNQRAASDELAVDSGLGGDGMHADADER